jgi:glycosyltransferase involved in cell wall biosynthesis
MSIGAAGEHRREARDPEFELSIIVPAYNEEDNVGLLHEAVVAAMSGLGESFELIFVDDGSSDQTFARLAEIAARDDRVRVIKLRRNYGQTPAMVAGIDHARGRVLITMDADLQNDPADIPRLLEKIRAGYDVVVGWRQNRQDKWLSRRLPSVVANRLIAKVTGVDVKDNGCTLKAFRAELIKPLPLYAELHRFIPAMLSTAGCRLAELEVRHHPRRFGSSKYGLSRIYKVCLDLIAVKTVLVFSRRPLAWFAGAAAITVAFGALSFVAALYYALSEEATSAVVFMGLSLLFGSLTIFLAMIGVIGSLAHRHVRAGPAPRLVPS